MQLLKQHAYDNRNLHLSFGQYYSASISVAIKSLWKTGLYHRLTVPRRKVYDHNIKAITKGCQSGKQYLVFASSGHHFMETKTGSYITAYAHPDN